MRGGGSLEDLWAFNTEAVARAIERSATPVVSGVGHETDFTIADWVADLRAPTPSAAVAVALPDRLALAAQLERDWRRLAAAMRAALRRAHARVAHESDALRMLAPSARLAAQRARLQAAHRALVRAIRARQERQASSLSRLVGRLHSLSPLAVLSRGYALVRRPAQGRVLRSADEAVIGERLAVRLGRGELAVRVESSRAADAEG